MTQQIFKEVSLLHIAYWSRIDSLSFVETGEYALKIIDHNRPIDFFVFRAYNLGFGTINVKVNFF